MIITRTKWLFLPMKIIELVRDLSYEVNKKINLIYICFIDLVSYIFIYIIFLYNDNKLMYEI